jgi:hypothetical protein
MVINPVNSRLKDSWFVCPLESMTLSLKIDAPSQLVNATISSISLKPIKAQKGVNAQIISGLWLSSL